jgi:hypothetical protein
MARVAPSFGSTTKETRDGQGALLLLLHSAAGRNEGYREERERERLGSFLTLATHPPRYETR